MKNIRNRTRLRGYLHNQQRENIKVINTLQLNKIEQKRLLQPMMNMTSDSSQK